MKVKPTNGKSYKAFEPYPPGGPLNIVGRDVLRAKFRKRARAVLTDARIDLEYNLARLRARPIHYIDENAVWIG